MQSHFNTTVGRTGLIAIGPTDSARQAVLRKKRVEQSSQNAWPPDFSTGCLQRQGDRANQITRLVSRKLFYSRVIKVKSTAHSQGRTSVYKRDRLPTEAQPFITFVNAI